MLDNNDEITRYNSDMGNYDYSKKKKKSIYYDEENLSEDTDGDGPDYIERRTGVHNAQNKHVKHMQLGGNLRTTRSGMIILPHQFLSPIHINKKISGKMRLSMDEPKKMKLSLDIKNPKMSFSMKQIKIPVAKMDDTKIKTNTGSFETKYLKKWLKEVEFKRKKRKGMI